MAQYRLLIAAALLGSALLAPGCQGQSTETAPAETATPPHEAAAALLQEVSQAEFQVPADGRLTDEQVRMYLEVRERQQGLRRAALEGLGEHQAPAVPATPLVTDTEMSTDTEISIPSESADTAVEALEVVGDHADPALAELQAVRELGFNPKEYLWVRDQVREAQIARADLRLSRRLTDTRDRYLARLEAEKVTAATPEERAAIEQRIATFREGIQQSEPELPPAVAANAELLERYEERLAAVWTGEDRLAARPENPVRRDDRAKAGTETD
ncbi:MAG TPA: hypothetical protein VHU81_06505 [Thermoanaerobaculia bacterium]|nr:hypothetical protein [Thermoanaerobaculia bacterium]